MVYTVDNIIPIFKGENWCLKILNFCLGVLDTVCKFEEVNRSCWFRVPSFALPLRGRDTGTTALVLKCSLFPLFLDS